MTAPHVCLSTVEYPPRVGGVAVAAARLARTLASAGLAVTVFTPVSEPTADGTADLTIEDGVRVYRCRHRDPTSLEGQFAFRRALLAADTATPFDILHGFFLTAAYPLLSLRSPGRARPLIASIRGADVLTLMDLPPARALLLPVLRQATWVTSVNAAYLARVAEEVAIDGRSSVIRNGIVSGGGHHGWKVSSHNRGVVGTIGEFRRVKDIPLLVRAYTATSPALRRRLLLAGFFSDADEEQWSRTLVEEAGLTAEVEVTGRFAHPEVEQYLARMHVYVQPSADEGLPNALLEAASYGVPLIATAVGGMREVLTDGVSGRLVPHGDPAAMSAAMADVLSDEALANRLSAGARLLAEELSPARERQEWVSLYERLLRS